MKHLRLFETEAAYTAATLDLPVVSYVKATGTVHYDGKHAVDRVLNAPLMNMCVANNWAKESEDYLTFEEAAVVSTLPVADLITYEVVSAWELKYFTGLTSISYTGITQASNALKYLYIPDEYQGTPFNIRPIVNSAYILLFPNIIKLHNNGTGSYPGAQPDYTSTRAEQTDFANTILYIGPGITGASSTNSYLGYFKTIIADCSPMAFGDQNTTVVQGMTLWVKSSDIAGWQAVKPWSRNTSSVKDIANYIGDPDY